MTDAGLALHTGAHAGIWGAIEVLFALVVLGSAVALVLALFREARDGSPEALLAAAFAVNERRSERVSSPAEPRSEESEPNHTTPFTDRLGE
jgi:hypothetical protein